MSEQRAPYMYQVRVTADAPDSIKGAAYTISSVPSICIDPAEAVEFPSQSDAARQAFIEWLAAKESER